MNKNLKGSANSIHPGIAYYKGKSYYFYHKEKLPVGKSITSLFAFEEFEYNEDGTFPQFTVMTVEGPKQIENFDPFQKVPLIIMCFESGIQTKKNDDGSHIVISIKDGS